LPPGSYRNKGLALAPIQIDEDAMPDEHTKNLFHFDSNFNDVSGDSWLTNGAWYVAPPGNSNWTIQASAAKFGAGGIQDLAIPANNWGILKSEVPSKFWYGTGDFTLEYWIRINSITTPGATTNLLDFLAAADSSNYWQFYSRLQGTGSTSSYNLAVGAATLSGGSWSDVKQSGYQTVNVGDWVHIAGVRNAGTFTVYVNGSSVLSFSSTSAQYVFNLANTMEVTLQRVYNGASAFNGTINIDEFRAANYAMYTGNFTPPISPYGLVKDNKLYFSDILRLLTRLPDSDTMSLFHFDEAGDETNDIGAASWSFTTKDAYADVTINPSGKFDGALYDGTGTSPDAWWMTTTATTTLNIGGGDFSMEFWFKATGNQSYNTNFNALYIEALGLPLGTFRFCNLFFFNNDYTTKWGINPYYGGDQMAIAGKPADGSWHHVCLERYSGTVTIYVDGISEYTSTGNMAIANFTNATSWRIGRANSSGMQFLGNWYIDELKFAKKAIYKGNFTPPTIPYYWYGTNKLGLGE
jgi:hypothetical protein